MFRATLTQQCAYFGALVAFAFPLAPAARSQEFAGRPIACVSLDCAAAGKTYSFDETPDTDTQQSSANASVPPKPATGSDPVREGVWRKLPSNFVHDQKDMWLLPVKVAQGHYWLPTALVTVSLIRKDSYGQATSLLAGEAVVDDTIVMIVAKAITRRQRPTDIPVNGNYSDTFFKSGSGPLGKGSSFPSGHAMMAFSVATVFAHRYREHRWIPYLAYGVAAAISFSRITTGAHFPSDVLFGAATGFAIARFGVLHGQ
jgi:hypothetical protein